MRLTNIRYVLRNIAIVHFAILLLVVNKAQSQVVFYNKGVQITNISEEIFIQGDLQLDSGGFINNANRIVLTGNIINNSDSDLCNPANGVFSLEGALVTIGGTHSSSFHNLFLSNCDSVTLFQDILVSDSLFFIEGNIDLNSYSINLDTSGKLIGESDTAAIFGNSGKIVSRKTIYHPTITDNISGMGLFLCSNTDSVSVFIERRHNRENAADSSIYRNFTLYSETPFFADSIRINYFASERKPASEESSYKIFQKDISNNGGWVNKGGLCDFVDKNVASNAGFNIDSIKLTIASQICQINPLIIIASDTIFSGNDSTIVGMINCYNDTVSVFAESNDPNPYVVWQKDSVSTILSNPLIASESGLYIVSVSDGVTGCTASGFVLIGIDVAPVVYHTSLQDASISCSQNSILLNDTSNLPEYTLSWILPDGSPAANPCTATDSGNYVVVSTKISSGCSGSDTVYVGKNNILLISTSNDTIVCKNSSVLLEANEINHNSQVNFQWSSGASDSIALVIPQQTGTYYVTATLANCAGLDSVLVNVSPDIHDSIVSYVACDGSETGTISVYATGGTPPLTYSADLGGSFLSNNVFEDMPYGQYTMLTQDSVGCVKTGEVLLDGFSNLPVPLFIASSINDRGDSIVLIDISSPTHPDSIKWVFDPPIVEIVSQDTYYIVITFPDTGAFSVTMIAYWDDCTIDTTKPVFFNFCDSGRVAEQMLGIKSVALSPNPNNGEFLANIELYQPQEVCLQIWNMKAQVFYNVCFSDMDAISTYVKPDKQLPLGEYFLRVISPHGSVSIPFIVGYTN